MIKNRNWNDDILSTADDLRRFTRMSENRIAEAERVIQTYPMRIPLSYYALIDQSDPEDPIAKMCLPSIDELDPSGSFDTSGEQDNTAQTGLQHKYSQTALILTTNVCAMYCRHCFRKRLVGISKEELNKQVDQGIRYVHEHPEINNVLLSGGDALMLPNVILRRYLDELSSVDSLDFIRIGSRVPVVFPERILQDDERMEILRIYGKKKALYLVTQFNHPREIGEKQKEAIRLLLPSLSQIRNQTVLLKGVNDNGQILGDLLRKLTGIGVAPYYVFQCRPVRGVKGRFQVPLLEAADIIADAKALQNGIGKSFRFAMSHPRGKIEILGTDENRRMLFKFHQSKYKKDEGLIFSAELSPYDTWLDESLKGI